LKITNETNETVGVYCGQLSGTTVFVTTGRYVYLTFRSNSNDVWTARWTFLLIFTGVPIGKYKEYAGEYFRIGTYISIETFLQVWQFNSYLFAKNAEIPAKITNNQSFP